MKESNFPKDTFPKSTLPNKAKWVELTGSSIVDGKNRNISKMLKLIL